MKTFSKVLLTVVVILAVIPFGGAAQDTLSIVNPASGVTIIAGQSLEADVQGSFDTIVLGCDIPLQCTQISSSNNISQWSVVAPIDIAPGQYFLQASASQLKDHSNAVLSNRISVSVPFTNLPNSLTFSPANGSFSHVGEQKSVRLIATMANGSSFDVSELPQTRFNLPPNIQRVGHMYTALSSGNGTVSATLTVAGSSLSATFNFRIPELKVGDLNGDGKVDTDDLNILLGFRNRPSSSPNDARDLNHDGKIDALDARILTTLCTYPRCATHP